VRTHEVVLRGILKPFETYNFSVALIVNFLFSLLILFYLRCKLPNISEPGAFISLSLVIMGMLLIWALVYLYVEALIISRTSSLIKGRDDVKEDLRRAARRYLPLLAAVIILVILSGIVTMVVSLAFTGSMEMSFSPIPSFSTQFLPIYLVSLLLSLLFWFVPQGVVIDEIGPVSTLWNSVRVLISRPIEVIVGFVSDTLIRAFIFVFLFRIISRMVGPLGISYHYGMNFDEFLDQLSEFLGVLATPKGYVALVLTLVLFSVSVLISIGIPTSVYLHAREIKEAEKREEDVSQGDENLYSM